MKHPAVNFISWKAWAFSPLSRLVDVELTASIEGGILLVVGVRCESDGPYPAILLKSRFYIQFMRQISGGHGSRNMPTVV
jgi:hypothetical protein